MSAFANLPISRKLMAAFAAVVVVIFVSSAIVYDRLRLIEEAKNWRVHTADVLETLQTALDAMLDQETGVRGYLITGDEIFLEPYHRGKDTFIAAIRKIKNLKLDNPAQQSRLDELIERAKKWDSEIAEREIALMAKPETREDARALEASMAGKTAMDLIRAKMDEIARVERDLLAQRDAVQRQAFTTAYTMTILGGAASLIIAMLMGLLLTRGITVPITRMTSAMSAFAKGDTSVEVPGAGRSDEIGAMAAAIQVFKDSIIERQRAEEALRESEARFRTFVDHATDAFILHSEDATVLDVNRHACESLGYRREELIGMTPPDLHPDVKAASLQRIHERLKAGETVTFESRLRRKDGTVFPVEVRVREFRQGDRLLGITLARDITERKQAAEALREMQMELAHANRVATIGQLTASIAHEVNQPLSAIVTNASAALRWLAGQPPNLDEARESLGRIIKNGHRASEVIGRIRALIKKAPPSKSRFDLNEAVRDVIALTRSEVLKHGASLQSQLATGLPLIEGDRVQLQQVILNLIMNAVEAMSGVGEGPRGLRIGTETDASGGVLVTVRDTGPGLDLKSVDRLFEAFYTTKPEGMGMGLAICRSIIEAHGGRLWASANEPRGAVFQFTLPPEWDETVPAEHAGQNSVVTLQLRGAKIRSR